MSEVEEEVTTKPKKKKNKSSENSDVPSTSAATSNEQNHDPKRRRIEEITQNSGELFTPTDNTQLDRMSPDLCNISDSQHTMNNIIGGLCALPTPTKAVPVSASTGPSSGSERVFATMSTFIQTQADIMTVDPNACTQDGVSMDYPVSGAQTVTENLNNCVQQKRRLTPAVHTGIYTFFIFKKITCKYKIFMA